MPNRAELHTHLAPNVDDGSRSLEESLRSLLQFRDEGVTRLAVTPHLTIDPEREWRINEARIQEVRLGCDLLADACARFPEAGLPEIIASHEIFAPTPQHIEPLLDREDIGLGKNPFLLVEFGFSPRHRGLEVIERTVSAGRHILVAHPERYAYEMGQNPLDVLRAWKEAGAFLQVNLGSFLGYYAPWSPDAQRLAWEIVEAGLADALASDHHAEARPQILHTPIRELFEARGGGEIAELLMGENPHRILRGEAPLPVPALTALA